MMDQFDRFRGQFILTSQKHFTLGWEKADIQNYALYHHPDVEYTHSTGGRKELYLLGSLYDWEKPERSNQEITDMLVSMGSVGELLEQLSGYAGEYVIVRKDDEGIILLNDACAQKGVYYDTSFTSFGSQPILLSEVIALEPQTSREAVEFYSSPAFATKKVFVGESTPAKNIRHLLPNHYIDITYRSVRRFFPEHPINPVSTKNAAKLACQMLKGYIRAMAMRNEIAVAVTAGSDSRILFLASLDTECKYFVSQHKNMTDRHYDISIPRKLTQLYGKRFEVIPDNEDIPESLGLSVDYPSISNQPKWLYKNHLYLNGNISEIARNFYGNFKNVSARELAFIRGYRGLELVENEYNRWLADRALLEHAGYSILDMFYWEQVMSTRVAKAKTERAALGMIIVSPFCSRGLLELLLSTPRKDRCYYQNKLYEAIMLGLSPKALDVPTNPKLKLKIIKWMTRLKVYDIYRFWGLKLRFLKF